MIDQVENQTLTMFELADQLIERTEISDTDQRGVRRIRRSIISALRDTAAEHDWQHYFRAYRFYGSASLSVDECVYDAAANTITIPVASSDIWPADAAEGELVIGDLRYEVIDRVSDTVLSINGPLQSGTYDARWLRAAFRIPTVERVHGLWEESTHRPIPHLDPPEFESRRMLYPNTGTPVFYSVFSGAGSSMLHLSHAPAETIEFSLACSLQPAFPKTYTAQVPVTGTSGTFEIASADNALNSSYVGDVVRLGSGLEDYTWQALIKSVQPDGSSATVSVALPSDVNAMAYISSPLDIAHSMQTYLFDHAYALYCKVHGHEDYQRAMVIANNSLVDAKRMDSTVNRSDRHASNYSHPRYPLVDLHDIDWVD